MRGKVRYMYPGGNTPFGFYSFYEDILPQRKANKIFCIKGGPGTGKSTFIKSIGEYFVNKGEDIDFFRCSADPDSYDGVLLNKRKVLIVDGTSPHIIDPRNPAAVDKVIDFGKFWDEQAIKGHREEIVSCNEKISRLYGVAYGYLNCLLHEYELIWQLIREYINEQQIDKIISDIISHNQVAKYDEKGTFKRMFASAISSKGVLNELEVLNNTCNEVCAINVPVGFKSQMIMEPIMSYFINSGYNVEGYYCPVDPKRKIEHLIVPDLSLMIATCNKYHTIRANKCYEITLDTGFGEYGAIMLEELYRQSDKTIKDAVSMLKRAKISHDLLESYYINYIDFDSVNCLNREIIVEIQQDSI